MGHHHHHHHHSHQRDDRDAGKSSLLGLDSGLLKNLNIPSLATSLIGNMDMNQIISLFSNLASSPIRNNIAKPQFTAPAAQESHQAAVEDIKEAEHEQPKETLNLDPAKLAGMMNMLTNMLGLQTKSNTE
jgi:hypothetical protein